MSRQDEAPDQQLQRFLSQLPGALGFCVLYIRVRQIPAPRPASVFFSMVTAVTVMPTQALVGTAKVLMGLLVITSALGLGNLSRLRRDIAKVKAQKGQQIWNQCVHLQGLTHPRGLF